VTIPRLPRPPRARRPGQGDHSERVLDERQLNGYRRGIRNCGSAPRQRGGGPVSALKPRLAVLGGYEQGGQGGAYADHDTPRSTNEKQGHPVRCASQWCKTPHVKPAVHVR
jgi:hypothetical protein